MDYVCDHAVLICTSDLFIHTMTYYCWFTDPLVDFLFQNSGKNCPQLVRVYCDLTDLTKNSLVSVPLML